MFNVTAKIRKLLKAGVNVTVGTDSSATGSVNFLEELRYDRDLYRSMYGEDLPAQTLFGMATVNAAKAFKLEKKLGTLEAGKFGDILVVKRKCDDVFENLISARMEDIELLTLEGKAIYGEMRFVPLLNDKGTSQREGALPAGYSTITVGGRPMFVSGDPAALYSLVREKVGYKKELGFLPFEPAPLKEKAQRAARQSARRAEG
jgi:hypothetical protein